MLFCWTFPLIKLTCSRLIIVTWSFKFPWECKEFKSLLTLLCPLVRGPWLPNPSIRDFLKRCLPRTHQFHIQLLHCNPCLCAADQFHLQMCFDQGITLSHCTSLSEPVYCILDQQLCSKWCHQNFFNNNEINQQWNASRNYILLTQQTVILALLNDSYANWEHDEMNSNSNEAN